MCPEWNAVIFAQTVELREQKLTSSEITPQTASSIAKEAYIYGFPMVDNYRVMHGFAVDRTGPGFLAPFNQIHNKARVFTPQDRTIPMPNSDTAYSMAYLDLRAEPVVLTIPRIEKDRYFSVQLVDLYTFNFEYVGSRTTGNDGGDYLVAGPNWSGEVDPGVQERDTCSNGICAGDLSNSALQAGRSGERQEDPGWLSCASTFEVSFVGRCPAAGGEGSIPRGAYPRPRATIIEFFNILRFVLQFCPTQSGEQELRERFARIGVVPGHAFEPAKLKAEMSKRSSREWPTARKRSTRHGPRCLLRLITLDLVRPSRKTI